MTAHHQQHPTESGQEWEELASRFLRVLAAEEQGSLCVERSAMPVNDLTIV